MRDLRFPDGFLWGTASSSHQVEGGNHNNWTQWEKSNQRHIKDGSHSGAVTDHWNRYAKDYDYLTEMHLTAHRFSVEWSRIEPKRGEFDEAALKHYSDMVDALLARGITPMVTLHHFTNPLWIEAQGGWSSHRTVEDFERFAVHVAEVLGDRVKFWCTLNEPTVEVGLGFMVGTFPPGRTNLISFLRARRHMVSAHLRVYYRLHRLYRQRKWPRAMISFAHHLSYVEPHNPRSPLDRLVTRIYNQINNLYFLQRTRGRLDFIGVNYYFYRRLSFALGGPLLFAREMPLPDAPESDLGWPVVPEGLYRLCKQLSRYRKPIYITENGLADAQDRLRPWSLVAHAAALHRAIAEGVDVRGYFHWSLTDTFEWENGFDARYGLVAVDFATQHRHARPSAKVYAQITDHNSLSKELQERYL